MIKWIYNKLPWNLKEFFLKNKGYLNWKQYKKNYNSLNKAYKEYQINKSKRLLIKDGDDIWLKSFKKFIVAQPKECEVAIEFFKSDIIPIKINIGINKEKNISLICVIKDDYYRIQKLLSHYRKLGIKHFIILDNNSTDGTREYLSEQSDVDTYLIREDYNTNRREAWVNRLISHYGVNRWYINVDSDELLSYIEYEKKDINELIKWGEKNNIFRFRALMIDMYSDCNMFTAKENVDYYQQYCYFDNNTYYYESNVMADLVKGGPRKRLFNQAPCLTKFPIFKFEIGDVQGKSHYQFPYRKNRGRDCYLGLLHYKFLPVDCIKYSKIAKEGNFHNGSVQYKAYLDSFKNEKEVNFKHIDSKYYENSSSLSCIDMIKKISW